MGKKKKSAPQGATPEEEVRYMIELSRETHAKGTIGSAVFQVIRIYPLPSRPRPYNSLDD